jgi:CHASE1-domain containing sensor protein
VNHLDNRSPAYPGHDHGPFSDNDGRLETADNPARGEPSERTAPEWHIEAELMRLRAIDTFIRSDNMHLKAKPIQVFGQHPQTNLDA